MEHTECIEIVDEKIEIVVNEQIGENGKTLDAIKIEVVEPIFADDEEHLGKIHIIILYLLSCKCYS